ncbi:type I DNA topoisomerase [Helicobacter trogontum]|uniref:DNA topoisomerase 1 n=1 Tax=Helicobacter trogontum TaxID=50960 RepID=A0A4U8S9C0_9HELI|nr:type I DNA topoisomerase [Helicobacter trogontum]TLD82570.1 type I DNA topoisomerase [Helicobacter trogontum]
MATTRVKKATAKENAKTSTKKATNAKNLIIVESPAKARTIKNFLGKDYEVIASKGHIRDLPQHRFGITIKDKHFIPTYDISKDHALLVKEIQNLHKSAKVTYIATDEDREGEAIGYHIVEALKGDIAQFPRIVFHEITKSAITHSLENPRLIDMDRVNAQQARRLLDRIVGFKLSGLLSQKISRGLSAGRVQSSALKILVDREKEIRAFKPQDYFLIEAYYTPNIDSEIGDSKEAFTFDLVRFKEKKIEKLVLQDGGEVEEILAILHKESFHVESIQQKERITKSPPPFMTSTLQQASSNLLGFSPTKTMSIAQKLYEGVKTKDGLAGVITYMRTDSLNIAKEALENARNFINTHIGVDYLPSKAKVYTATQKGAQEAHEAIRPTNLSFTPQIAANYLGNDELKLYTLIFNRFVASQMKDAVFESLSVGVVGANSEFKISGRRLVFDGFYKILGNADKDKLLPHFQQGQAIHFKDIQSIQKTTEPPPHYSEAGLIKTLESLGIGRPSTYAPTIKILIDRKYVELEKKQLVVQDIAFNVIAMLETEFEEIVDSGFSAALESKLDGIAENKLKWEEVLWEFYEPFIDKITKGKTNIKSQKVMKPTGEMCPECGNELVIRNGRYGEFVSCSNYPQCKFIKKEKQEVETSDETCEKCGRPMIVKMSKRGKFLACSGYPECKNAQPLEKPKELSIACPKCGGKLLERKSKRGIFYGCANYPTCKFITNAEPTTEKCPKCSGMLCWHKTKENAKVCVECKNVVT